MCIRISLILAVLAWKFKCDIFAWFSNTVFLLALILCVGREGLTWQRPRNKTITLHHQQQKHKNNRRGALNWMCRTYRCKASELPYALCWQANRNENVCNYCQVHHNLLLYSNFAILKWYANFEETLVLGLFYYADHMTDLARIWTLLNSLPIHYFITLQMT